MLHRMARPIPAEVIFNPHWWYQNYGISFDESFYFDRELRIQNDLKMRRALYERFRLGEPNPGPRPIVGSEHVAGGFVMPALFGCRIRFEADAAPTPVPCDLGAEEALALTAPDIATTWPMSQLIADLDSLQSEFGCVCGDFNLGGILNTALDIRGQQFFMDFYEAPELARHLLSLITEAQIAVATYMRARTGTLSLSTNRSTVNVDPSIFLHSNCSVQMVSPKVYEEFLFPYEKRLAEKLAPYGIHHCGDNLQLYTQCYARLPVVFFDVGWGSDVARCREELPGAFLNLRLNPVRMLQCTAAEIRRDAEQLLAAADDTRKVGLCCINMDYGTPDENVRALLEVAASGG
jgi:uroporphyrinogen-III decarboxylase